LHSYLAYQHLILCGTCYWSCHQNHQQLLVCCMQAGQCGRRLGLWTICAVGLFCSHSEACDM
jgi:hypothetical protein